MAILIMASFYLQVKQGCCITCHEAVDYAIKQSEAIQMSDATAETIRQSGKQSVAFIWPTITAKASYAELDSSKKDSVFYPFLNQPDRDVSASLEFSQLLFAGGRIWMSNDLKQTFDSLADWTQKMGKRQLAMQVRMAYYQALYQQAAVDILQDRLKQRNAELEDAEDLKNVGVVTSLDVRQAQLSLNLAKDELNAAQAKYQDVLIHFNVTMGRSGNETLFVPEGTLSGVDNLSSILNKVDDALKNNLLMDIQMASLETETSQIHYQFEKAKHYPEFALVAQAKKNGDDFDNCFNYYQIGAQISYPLFDGFLIRSQIHEKKANLNKSKAQQKKIKKSLEGTIRSLHVNHDSLEIRIRLQKQAIDLSKDNYDDARGQYRAGTITITQLGEFNLSYAEARFNLLRIYFFQCDLYVQALALIDFI